MGLTLDIDEEGGIAILHSLKGEKNCWFPSIVEIEMPVETTLEEMVEILNRRPIQESFEHAIVGTSLVAAARLQDKHFEIQDLKAELAQLTAQLAEWRADAERLIQLSNFKNKRAGEYFELHEQLVEKYGGENNQANVFNGGEKWTK